MRFSLVRNQSWNNNMKNRKYFSVIIPTYNRKEKLEKCLKALFRQTYPRSRYEIIVVDDGSSDGTQEMVKRKEKRSPVPLHFIRQENSGPARARNVGIRESQGDLLLITGDDILAERTLLEEHWRFHWKYPEEEAAVLCSI